MEGPSYADTCGSGATGTAGVSAAGNAAGEIVQAERGLPAQYGRSFVSWFLLLPRARIRLVLRRSEAGRQQSQEEDSGGQPARSLIADSSLTRGPLSVKRQRPRYHRPMRFHTEYLKFQTKQHRQYINITPEVDAALKKSGIREGMILVSAMHITAGVWVNDAEDGLLADIDEWLEKLAPFRENYRHHRTGETNGDSHLKSLMVHHQVIVPVTEGRLDFGPWQQVYYAEFDGQRPKRVIIKVMGE